jgi:hypothetical protein
MKLVPILGAVLVMGLTSSPAFALFCANEGPSAGFSMDMDNRGKLRRDNEFQKEFDLMRLREAGVNASSVERWNGCLRAFVPRPGGGEAMEFYDPATLRRLQ